MLGDKKNVLVCSNPITSLRDSTRTAQTITAVVLGFFLWFQLYPSVAAAKDATEQARKSKVTAPAADNRHADTLETVVNNLKALDEKAAKNADIKTERAALKELKAQLQTLDEETLAYFDGVETHIKKHKLSEVILKRHLEAVDKFKADSAALRATLSAIETAPNASLLRKQAAELRAHLEKLPFRRVQAPFDPNNLPFQAPKLKPRKAKLTEKEFDDLFRKMKVPAKRTAEAEPLQVASTGALTGLLSMAAVTPPGPEYLAPTEDVQISQPIRDLAASLDRRPVKIYNWVVNNIDFIPTYGSVQGSQMTLDKKAGNAFDTASLLIALFRASGIPARYVYGTVEIPIEKLMNWAGGFTSPDAAQTFLATGGIPNTALTKGGKTVAIQMEHVWVEAFVDFYPSRGVKNITPDAWVPMDASYKYWQYTYTEGMNLRQNVPFDAQDFLTAAQQGASVNEQEGWVQNMNQANIQIRLDQYQQQLQSFIAQQKPDATVGDVLGKRTINQYNMPHLAASLPYHLVVKGNTFATLPSGLRHKFRYSLYADAHQQAIENPIFTYEESTPKLAGKKVTLTFIPASDGDRQTLESYLPRPHEDGSPIQPGEFPQSLPAYSIQVTPELRVDDLVVARGGSFTLGTELLGEGGFTRLEALGDWDLTTDLHVAGQASALGLSLQGIGADQLNRLRERLAAAQAKIAERNLSGLSAEQINGDILTGTIWSYFASVEDFGQGTSLLSRMVDKPGLSYGFFHAQVIPIKRYGVVMQARYPGVLMDVGHMRRVAWSKDNDRQRWIDYNQQRSYQASAMEHEVPEQFFSAEGTSVEGISAVKSLQLASGQGQRIFRITSQNVSAVLPQLSVSGAVKDEIQSAAAAGKVITISQGNVSISGFSGVGYIIADPDTGAGAYLISGGANGGSSNLCNSLVLAIQILLITAIVIAAIAVIGLGAPLIGPAAVAAWEVITAAVSSIATAAVRAAVAASLGVFVVGQATAGEVIRLCINTDQDETSCLYLCQDGSIFSTPRPRNWCGNIMNCEPFKRQPAR